MPGEDWDKDFEFNENEWEEVEEKNKPAEIKPAVYDYGEKASNRGIAIGAVGYSKNGKTLMGTLLPWLNQKWWSSSPAKQGKYIDIEKYPLVREMIKTGLIPEVSEIQVIDLDGSFESKSKYGIFGRLVDELYKANMIRKTTIKVPGRIVKIGDGSFRELAKKEIELAKLKIDNEVQIAMRDNDETVALMIDPFDEIERLLTNMFRITYEENIAPVRPLKSGKTKDFYSSSLDGIPRKFWYMRNSWFEDMLRAKRDYKGYCYDTFKIDWKDPEYSKEGDLDYKIAMTKRSHYFMDLIIWFDSFTYEAKVINRFKGEQDKVKPLDFTKAELIPYSKRKPKAIYEIFEKLAPSLMGMIEKEDGTFEYDDIYE